MKLSKQQSSHLVKYVYAMRDSLNAKNTSIYLTTLLSSPVDVNYFPTGSILSSPHLTCQFIRNLFIRNNETPTPGTVRKVLSLLDKKHSVWQHSVNQKLKQKQLEAQLRHLQTKLEFKQLEAKFKDLDLTSLENEITMLKRILTLQSSAETCDLYPGNEKAILGMRIRVAGPKRGQKSVKWDQRIGTTAMKSVGLKHFASAQAQIPSWNGVYGITVGIVYRMQADLVDDNFKVQYMAGEKKPFSASVTQ